MVYDKSTLVSCPCPQERLKRVALSFLTYALQVLYFNELETTATTVSVKGDPVTHTAGQPVNAIDRGDQPTDRPTVKLGVENCQKFPNRLRALACQKQSHRLP